MSIDDRTEEHPPDHTDEPTDGTSRRALLGRGGVAAAVATVAAIGLSRRAEAADGENLRIGEANEGTAATLLGGGSYFAVTNGSGGGFGGEPASIVGRTTLTSGVGVYGEGNGDNTWGVLGVNLSDDGYVAIEGLSLGSGGTAVYGFDFSSADPGVGVHGRSNRGTGVLAQGAALDLLADESGRIRLGADGVASPPAGASVVGTIARDAGGTLWCCVTSGTPGTWREVAGPTTAGSFHAITPVRVFDSRVGGFPNSGVFTPGSTRTVSVADGRNQATGSVTAANAVPAGATAVTYNVTATNTTGGSFLAVVPGDVTTTDVSTLNWAGAGVSIANASVSKLDGSRQLRIIAGPGGNVDVIIDITGYYR